MANSPALGLESGSATGTGKVSRNGFIIIFFIFHATSLKPTILYLIKIKIMLFIILEYKSINKVMNLNFLNV